MIPPRFSGLVRSTDSCRWLAVHSISMLLWCLASLQAEIPDTSKLQTEEWAANGMTKDPVALSFDHLGKLYVVESARRASVDIDIRAHRDWLLEDLANDSFATMRDFFRRRMATELSEQNKQWLQDRNGDGVHDFRDLTTISERIRVIEDTDGDGKADKSHLYADGFNEEFTGVAAGVMPYEGDVLFTVYPDLWRLRDTNGDGKADQRESMFRGFGVHAAFDGHDLHGLTVGPEGKIYFSCGDNGFSVVTKEGKRLHHPNTGGVLRMNPDGSDLEVFAYGLRNVQEFDFDQFGNMFGVDNDGDLEDERERAVYIAEGSDSGWRLNWQFRSPGWSPYNGGMSYCPWTAEGMWKPYHSQQPAHITPPMENYSVGPGGFKFNPGTALNDEYRDFFFCVQFPVQKITAFRTRAHGAGFEMVDEHTFHTGLMVSSVNFGPDGGCYLADWVGKWSPNNEGVIYRVDDPSVQGSNVRAEVQQLVNRGVHHLGNDQLVANLGHQDRRVRQLAQFELVERRLGSVMLQVARSHSSHQLARIHALWGLLQLADSSQLSTLAHQLPWHDVDAQIRQQCCRVAGDLKLTFAEEQLIRLLQDPVPLVRSHAAIALGKAGSEQAVDALFELLRRNADLDPFLRHGAVMGLTGTATDEQLAARHRDPSAAVRVGAVLALRRKRSSGLLAYLTDDDVRVRREAVRAAHDDFSVPAVLPDLAAMLNADETPADEPTLRRLISACFRIGDAQSLLEFILSEKDLGSLSDNLRLEALECLARWDDETSVDRVVGRIRLHDHRSTGKGKLAFAKAVDQILRTGSPSVCATTLRMINDQEIAVDAAAFRQWVTSDDVVMNARVEALRLLHERHDSQVDAIIQQILSTKTSRSDDGLWTAAFALLVERHPNQAFERISWDAPIPRRQFFISQLPRFASVRSDRLLERMVGECIDGSLDQAFFLDVLAAAKQRAKHVASLQAFEARIDQQTQGAFAFASRGGDARRGESIYRSHVSAQCIRCHNAGGKGKQAGPLLDNIGAKPRDYLLQALVEPNAKIAEGFESVSVLRQDGKVVTGTVISENDDELVLGAPNKTFTIRKGEIEERMAGDQSAMPKMTDVLTPLEVRDIVAYLSTLRE